MREQLFTLTRSQRDDLWRRYKQTTERRVAECLHAILLLDEGRSARDVCAILHLHPKTLNRWIRSFASGGVEALTSFHYVGNTTSLTDVQLQHFTTWVDEQVRSTKEAIAWVDEQFGLDYTESGMLKLLKRLGYRYKKPAQIPSYATFAEFRAAIQRLLTNLATYTEELSTLMTEEVPSLWQHRIGQILFR